ncbi:MAG: glutathione S-transferase family protein [Pseudomonadales bacterium]
MSKPILYGISSSRALRSIWAMEETGIDYEQVPTNFREDSKSPEYLAVNPNGRIPALVDGDVVLFESMAINLYLAKKYGGRLYPDNAADEARTWQWGVWAISEIEPLQMQIVIQKLFIPKDKQDAAVIERAGKSLSRPLKVLDDALKDRDWLVGDHFSIADLNVAAVMELLQAIKFELSPFGNVQRWVSACYARPSFERATSRP